MAKTITVSDAVYKKLLERVANHQKKEDHRVSMSEVINKLLEETR